MTQDISKEVLALSIHVAAAASQITIQTQQRMTLVTNSVIESVDQTLKIINSIMMQSQKQSHLDAVIEEFDEDYGKDSKTRECYKDQQQNGIENEQLDQFRIENLMCQENCNPNLSVRSTNSSSMSAYKSKNNSQIIEEHPHNKNLNNDTPIQQKKQSLLSQQLSQIKVDKEKEAQEQKELMLLIDQVDPGELIPKLKSIEMMDGYQQEDSNQMDTFANFNEPFIVLNVEQYQKQKQKQTSPKKSEWYDSSAVEYKATSYNTNESSNLDHHSYKWKSSSIEDENLLRDCEFQFQSSVFDFPFPEDFQFLTIRKQKLIYSQKEEIILQQQEGSSLGRKFRESLAISILVIAFIVVNYKIQMFQLFTISQHQIFGKMKNRVLEIAKQFSESRYHRRGSSAQWKIPNKTFDMMQKQMKKLQQIQDENIQKLQQHQINSAQKNQGLFAKTQYFLTSIKKKILNSFEKDQKYKI